MIIKEQSGNSNWSPAPEGLHQGVCVDVTPPKQVSGKFGVKTKIRIVWEIDALMTEKDTNKPEFVGRPFLVSKSYTPSLHEKAALRKDLEKWRGRPFTKEELAGFDTEKLLGIPCQLLVQHATVEEHTYANLSAIMKAGATKLSASGKYKRVKDREEAKEHNQTSPDWVNDEIDKNLTKDEEIEF